jgi:DNA-binding response OmpR family regulator
MTSSQTQAPKTDDTGPRVAAMIADDILHLPFTDRELATIATAVKTRRQQMQSRKTMGLMKGDLVKIGGSAPSHEHGGIVIVKYVNQKTVTVRSDSPAFVGTKWSRSRHVRIPISWLGEVV